MHPHPNPLKLSRVKFEGFPFLSYLAGTSEELKRIPKKPRREEFFGKIPVIADYLSGRAKGRSSNEEITYFHNHGTIGFQFAVLASRVFTAARNRGMGRELPTDWLLESIRD